MIYQKTVKYKLEGEFKKEKVKSEKSCHFVISHETETRHFRVLNK